MNINKEQVFGVVRTIAAFGLGYLASSGVIDAGQVETIAAALGTIAVAVWSVLSKKSPAA